MYFKKRMQKQSESSALPNFTACPSQASWSPVWTSPIACLTCRFLRGETGDQTAATEGKRWTTASSQNCKVITKLCIEHWHKHRCAHTDLAMYLKTQAHSSLFFPLWPLFLAEDRADCLLLWFWPSWWRSCCPNSVGEVWNQTPSALAKTHNEHRSWMCLRNPIIHLF